MHADFRAFYAFHVNPNSIVSWKNGAFWIVNDDEVQLKATFEVIKTFIIPLIESEKKEKWNNQAIKKPEIL